MPLKTSVFLKCLMAEIVRQAGAQMLSEERFQEAADLVVVADGVKVE